MHVDHSSGPASKQWFPEQIGAEDYYGIDTRRLKEPQGGLRVQIARLLLKMSHRARGVIRREVVLLSIPEEDSLLTGPLREVLCHDSSCFRGQIGSANVGLGVTGLLIHDGDDVKIGAKPIHEVAVPHLDAGENAEFHKAKKPKRRTIIETFKPPCFLWFIREFRDGIEGKGTLSYLEGERAFGIGGCLAKRRGYRQFCSARSLLGRWARALDDEAWEGSGTG